jgi:hypothetical protein
MLERRTLDFQSLDEVMPEVERLVEGHNTVGQWSLAQILDHLATAIRLTALGRVEPTPRPHSEAFRRRFFQRRRFPEGVEAPHPRLIPQADADLQASMARLREAIERWGSVEGPFPAHPLLGQLSKDEWAQFHCIHCAHHLGFANPR